MSSTTTPHAAYDHADQGGVPLPERIGDYRVLKRLGRGGMGEVLLAENDLGNKIAIKMLGNGGSVPEKHLARFRREAHTLSMLQHRNISRIHAVGEHEGNPYIAMEHVQGVSLSRLLRFLASPTLSTTGQSAERHSEDLSTIITQVERTSSEHEVVSQIAPRAQGPGRILPLQQSLAIVVRLCEAVQYAHERGVYHRDIKPSNIIVRRDGEPVLLDFGVAKLRNEANDELTLTGQLFGTVEYMSPEQALSSKDADERSDVYSIGAVLYELVTGRKHFVASGSLVNDAKRLEHHEPIYPRHHSRRIDKDLQAVILKALSPDPNRRYRSARQLGQDLSRYSDGEPVHANPPSPFYRLGRRLRRQGTPFVLSAAVLVLALLLVGYVSWEYYRRWGKWVHVFHQEFVPGAYEPGRFIFSDETGMETGPWSVDSLGLRMVRRDWCWLRDISVPGDVRVVIRFRYDDVPDGFETAINARRERLEEWWHVPVGYSAQVGGYQGSIDFVSVNHHPRQPDLVHAATSNFDLERDIVMTFQHEGEKIMLSVNGTTQSSAVDMLPLSGGTYGRIGFRCFNTGIHVKSIDVYHLSLPAKTSPLAAGDALLAAGHAEHAARAYLSMGRDYGKSVLSEKALVRAFMAARPLAEDHGRTLADSALAEMTRRFPRSRFWQPVREVQMTYMWREGRYAEVFSLLPEHYRRYPQTKVALRLRSSGVPAPPDSIREALREWVLRTTDVKTLDINYTSGKTVERAARLPLSRLVCRFSGLTDLDALSAMELTWLNCSDNRIRLLDPLEGQPLCFVDLDHNRVEDLSPLAQAPLYALHAAHNRISDIAPLRSTPLRQLTLHSNRISDLTPLDESDVVYLSIGHNRISDLTPLADVPLKRLNCAGNYISSLAPLSGRALEYLNCRGNPIDDFAPLRGMPLRDLDICYTGVTSLEQLPPLPLERLLCNGNNLRSLQPLTGMKLKELSAADNQIETLSPLVGMPLDSLDCSNNVIRDLRPLASLPLRHLSCSGNHDLDLSSLRGLSLLTLRCRAVGLSSLKAVATMPLRVLDCSNNRIADIQPLGGMELERLDCSFNAIESLQPLRDMPLIRLSCRGNRIRSLEPLRGMPLERLDCRDNPITTLEPLLHDPPAEFWFFSKALSTDELEKAVDVWGEREEYSRHRMNAEIALRLIQEDFEGLRSLAHESGGHYYLLVECHDSFADARDICRRAGGYLATFTTAAELQVVAGEGGIVWADIVEQGPELTWGTGEDLGVTGERYRHDIGGEHWIVYRGRLWKSPYVSEAGYVIEWDR